MKRSLFISVLAFALGFGTSALIARYLKDQNIEDVERRSEPAAHNWEQVAEGISEITLEGVPCNLDVCPVYKVILRRDGTATYTGTRNVSRIGQYENIVYAHHRPLKAEFANLVKLVAAQGYFDMNELYNPAGLIDAGTIITSVVHNGERKTIRNYSNQGPVELYGIEMTIEGVAAQIKWKEGKR